MSEKETDTMQEQAAVKPAFRANSRTVLLPESLAVAAAFGASCWLLDAFLARSMGGGSLQEALLPSGEALALRLSVVAVVSIAAAITSTFLFRELRLRSADDPVGVDRDDALLESFSECAFAVNQKGEIIDANQAAANLFAWPVNMFMPMKLDWLISEYIDNGSSGINSFAELASDDPACCRNGSVTVVGKALSGRKFVAELTCMPSDAEDRRYIVFVRERAESGSAEPARHEQTEA